MFCNGFKPSRDPQKGYGATVADFINLNRDKNRVGTDEVSIVIVTEGKPVAEQMWHLVQNVMTYAKKLVEPLLKMIGVLEAEMSPFCRRFESSADLKDEYIKYQAKPFVYNGRCGTGTADVEEDSGGGVPDASPKEIVLRRGVKHLQVPC